MVFNLDTAAPGARRVCDGRFEYSATPIFGSKRRVVFFFWTVRGECGRGDERSSLLIVPGVLLWCFSFLSVYSLGVLAPMLTFVPGSWGD